MNSDFEKINTDDDKSFSDTIAYLRTLLKEPHYDYLSSEGTILENMHIEANHLETEDGFKPIDEGDIDDSNLRFVFDENGGLRCIILDSEGKRAK